MYREQVKWKRRTNYHRLLVMLFRLVIFASNRFGRNKMFLIMALRLNIR